ncbi:hypothetical protein [Cetobacterium sp.]|uniref:hypothetical protein n=1 Tax=Cetobacterium sp. TaxID=2071632 RepID=UPI003F3A9027
MAIGSFEGLYTFLDVAEIYGIDSSCLRKQVARDKFVIDEDIKKIGTTWIITEQAMVKNFGTLKFEEYKKKQAKKERAQDKKINTQKVKTKSTRSNKKAASMNQKEEKVNDSWASGEIKGVELKSFAFNTNNSE